MTGEGVAKCPHTHISLFCEKAQNGKEVNNVQMTTWFMDVPKWVIHKLRGQLTVFMNTRGSFY